MMQVTVDGLSSYDDLGLIMTVDAFDPPEPKVYKVDVPGANGCINLTRALTGDAVFDNRNIELTFTDEGSTNFAALVSKITNLWSGTEHDFVFSFDHEYTYHGWFSVSKYKQQGNLKQFTVTIDADPYKHKKNVTQIYNSSTGKTAYCLSGRKMVQPRFEFSDDTVVIYDGKRYEMPNGTYTMDDIWFTEGMNELFFISANAASHITNGEMAAYTNRDIKMLKPVYEWYKGVTRHYVDKIKLVPNGYEISGVVTFTMVDSEGNSYTSSIDLGDFVLRTVGDVSDYIEIEGDTARLYRWITNDSGEYAPDATATVFAFDFDQLYSNVGTVASLTHNTDGLVTYTLGEANIRRIYSEVKHSDYMEGGQYQMTHEQMHKYRISQLRQVDTESGEIYNIKEESVFIDYEWSDL